MKCKRCGAEGKELFFNLCENCDKMGMADYIPCDTCGIVMESADIIFANNGWRCLECVKNQPKEDSRPTHLSEEVKLATACVKELRQALDENPELIETIKDMAGLVMDMLFPTIKKTCKLVVMERIKAFQQFKALGLSDELAVKMTLGR